MTPTGAETVPPRVVAFGEVMLRLSAPGRERLGQGSRLDLAIGGGEANVVVSLAQLGMRADLVTRLPANPLGEAVVRELRGLGVGTSFIQRGGDRVGLYFLERGATQRPSKVIYDRAGSGAATIDPATIDWPAILRGASWFHTTGITPAISQPAAQAALDGVSAAREMGVPVSIDLNYRSSLWRWGGDVRSIMTGLAERADVLVGNEEDADKVFGIRPESASPAQGSGSEIGGLDAAAYADVCARLHDRFPQSRSIALTLRSSYSASHNGWSGCLWHEGRFHTGRTYDIAPIVDRVGAGDAFAAGLIHGLLTRPLEPADVLEFAIAAGCLKHSIPGDFNLVDRYEVEALVAGHGSGRIVR
jgi:2-dehydro-3-deoxygluconokinase